MIQCIKGSVGADVIGWVMRSNVVSCAGSLSFPLEPPSGPGLQKSVAFFGARFDPHPPLNNLHFCITGSEIGVGDEVDNPDPTS